MLKNEDIHTINVLDILKPYNSLKTEPSIGPHDSPIP